MTLFFFNYSNFYVLYYDFDVLMLISVSFLDEVFLISFLHFFLFQLTCIRSLMWQRLQTVWCSCWIQMKAGTAMENTACPVSLPRDYQVMVRYRNNPLYTLAVIIYICTFRKTQLTNQNQFIFLLGLQHWYVKEWLI